MKKKILVAYASWAGSTAEVAEAIGTVLRAEDTDVIVCNAAEVQDIQDYQAVVVGGAVRVGRLHKAMPRFVNRFSRQLAGVPVAYFVVCGAMKEESPDNCKTAEGYLDQVRRRHSAIKPVDVGLFAGKFAMKNLGFPFNIFMKSANIPEEDNRDWLKINAWAAGLKNHLFTGNKV